MNVSATVNVLRLLSKPSVCLPHATLSTFDRLPIPVSKAFITANGTVAPDIRAIVLDKDNCFAKPKENVIYGPYAVCPLHPLLPNSAVLRLESSPALIDDREDFLPNIVIIRNSNMYDLTISGSF